MSALTVSLNDVPPLSPPIPRTWPTSGAQEMPHTGQDFPAAVGCCFPDVRLPLRAGAAVAVAAAAAADLEVYK